MAKSSQARCVLRSHGPGRYKGSGMKAAVVASLGTTPIYTEFAAPAAKDGYEVVQVTASALSHLTKARAAGAHYSSDQKLPAVAGTDGVGRTQTGQRVYFVLPEAPFGAMAEQSLVKQDQCLPIPEELDDVTAAAIANPGMSVWAALMERARFTRGETVLVNGATGSSGNMAVQLAKYLGAAKVIATGRNRAELERLRGLGADVTLRFEFDLEGHDTTGSFDDGLAREFRDGVDVVIDYLWGDSALAIMQAAARHGREGREVRFVQVGSAGGIDTLPLPSAALRSSSLVLMGSGLKSVPLAKLLAGVGKVFEAVVPARLELETRVLPLSDVESTWQEAGGRPRVVYTIDQAP